MNLGDLLSELRENILHDRSDRVSGADDYLWSDATLVRYINEAQRRFARKALILRDGSTPDCCRVTLVEGQTIYPLDPSVLAVLTARLADDAYDLVRSGHSLFDAYRPPDPVYFDTASLSAQPPGKPRAYSTDEFLSEDDRGSTSAVNLRFFPVPDATMNSTYVWLRVVRLPMTPFTVTRPSQVPEIPEDYHLTMLDWAAYLALRVVDHDAGNVARANEFRASFEAHVKEARTEVIRKLFPPQAWGFGRNGFTYER